MEITKCILADCRHINIECSLRVKNDLKSGTLSVGDKTEGTYWGLGERRKLP